MVSAIIPHMEKRLLKGFERLSVPLLDFANTNGVAKWFLQTFLRLSSGTWVWAFSHNLWELHGVEQMERLRPSRGVILVANHRSFFDMYVTSAVLYRHAVFMDRMFFPVRSNFFYTGFLGMLVNLLVAGGTMWPPVFRDERKEVLNPLGLEQMKAVIAMRGSVIGIHPEGTRGKGPDPYEFLPIRPGIGQLVQAVDPETVIIPLFILGMSNRISNEIIRNFKPAGQRGEPMRIWFGTPLTAGELQGEPDPQVIANRLMARVRELADQDRAKHGSYSRAASTGMNP